MSGDEISGNGRSAVASLQPIAPIAATATMISASCKLVIDFVFCMSDGIPPATMSHCLPADSCEERPLFTRGGSAEQGYAALPMPPTAGTSPGISRVHSSTTPVGDANLRSPAAAGQASSPIRAACQRSRPLLRLRSRDCSFCDGDQRLRTQGELSAWTPNPVVRSGRAGLTPSPKPVWRSTARRRPVRSHLVCMSLHPAQLCSASYVLRWYLGAHSGNCASHKGDAGGYFRQAQGR